MRNAAEFFAQFADDKPGGVGLHIGGNTTENNITTEAGDINIRKLWPEYLWTILDAKASAPIDPCYDFWGFNSTSDLLQWRTALPFNLVLCTDAMLFKNQWYELFALISRCLLPVPYSELQSDNRNWPRALIATDEVYPWDIGRMLRDSGMMARVTWIPESLLIYAEAIRPIG